MLRIFVSDKNYYYCCCLFVYFSILFVIFFFSYISLLLFLYVFQSFILKFHPLAKVIYLVSVLLFLFICLFIVFFYFYCFYFIKFSKFCCCHETSYKTIQFLQIIILLLLLLSLKDNGVFCYLGGQVLLVLVVEMVLMIFLV